VPRRKQIDSAAVAALFSRQERLACHRQLTALGLPLSTITYRIRPEGPWQRALPGVVLSHRGTPTRRERFIAALLFCGDDAVLTGLSALALRGVRAAHRDPAVHVLVPAGKHRTSFDFVVVQRTRRTAGDQRVNGLPVASVARAVIDACRRLKERDAVRELVAEVVQRRLCSVSDLYAEVRAGARQRSALSRRVLAEVDAGVRSVAEMRAREIMAAQGIPTPSWNVSLWSDSGEFIATPDAYRAAVAAAVQIDSMRWHLGPGDYKTTQKRQRDLTTHGVMVLPVAPDHVIDDETEFGREVVELLRAAGARPTPLGIHVGRHPAAA
jgi:hypothetical protein